MQAVRTGKLILHIGMYKTGTTSVQQFLCAREAELLQQGVLYPRACRHKQGTPIWGHHAVAAAVASMGASQTGDLWAVPGLGELREEIEAASASTLLLSAEDFCSLENPGRLAAAFAADEIQLVMYVRNQVDFANAMYYTMIVHLRACLSPEDYLRKTLWRVLDYHRLALRWRNAFPEARFLVCSYDEGSAARADIVRDFLGLTGLTGRIAPPEERLSSHPTLPACATRVLYDALQSGVAQREFVRMFDWMHKVYARLDRPRSRQCIDAARIRAVLKADFESSNSRLRREFMDGEDASPFAAPQGGSGEDADVDYFDELGYARATSRLILDAASR